MPHLPFRQRIASYIFSKIPFSLLGEITRTPIIIPYFHMVSNDEVLHTKYLYPHKNIKQFKGDLDFLLRNFNPISLFDLIDFLKHGCSLPDMAFLLTFDDGFREMRDIVAPLLLEKGIPATFFINSDFTDNRSICYQHKASILAEYFKGMLSPAVLERIRAVFLKHELNMTDIKNGLLAINYQQKDIIDEIAQLMEIDFKDYLIRTGPYMTTDHIKELITNGFTIGAHSIDHPLYSSLSIEEQLFQTIESVKFIREKFNLDYGVFAFPHTDNGVSKEYFAELYKSGLIDVTFGTGGMINDSVPRNIQRFSLESPLMPAEEIIALQFARKINRVMKRCNKIIRN